MKAFKPTPYFAVFCESGQSRFKSDSRPYFELLSFDRLRDRGTFIWWATADYNAYRDRVAWPISEREAARLVNLDALDLYSHGADFVREGQYLFSYNTCPVYF